MSDDSQPIHAIVTDIEGTTSSISFVKDVLFPYARDHLPEFVRTHADVPQVQQRLHDAAHEGGLDPSQREDIITLLVRWIDEDRKPTALKALQGMIWKQGYEAGAYRAHVYPDVAPQLRRWHDAGIPLYVYSSGSVVAQKLLFTYSDAGDLTPLFSGYFDTETGPKREPRSYAAIVATIGKPAPQILFLSDIIAELDAAAQAGMRTMQLCRAPEIGALDPRHPWVADFTHIRITTD
ncbi:MAG: acireductone synthase [Xanthomonadales bacterium]|nr:acireductone synthase [Xanthomonadales bacterium]